MIADPEDQIFVDNSNGNFHLLQNAQAVDAGTNLVLPTVFEDLDNISRPQGSGFDIGAYEYNTLTSVEEDIITIEILCFIRIIRIRLIRPQQFVTRFLLSIASETKQSLNVILKVYDVLGNEIAILVDEYRSCRQL